MRHVLPLLIVATSLCAQSPQRPLTKADIDRWMTELSNCGRWGKDDQLGTLNLITPAKRRQAAALAKEGVAVSLARETSKDKQVDNPDPYQHTMHYTGAKPLGQFSLDSFGVSYHGFQHSHMDALSHMFWDGKMYNGFSQAEVTNQGAGKLAITNVSNGIFTRGVLVDLPWLLGADYLEPDKAVSPEDLDAWEKKSGVRIQAGDVVLFRTGRWARRAAKGPWNISEQSAGLHARCARWIKQRDAAAVGSDAATDFLPSGIDGVTHPMHQLIIIAMGTHIFDNLDLEDLAREAGNRRRWDFLFTAAPIRIAGGTGSPLNPVAVF